MHANPFLPAAALVAALAGGCAVTGHPVERGNLGVARPASALLAVIDLPGTVTLESVASADWAVDRGGLVNLDHPAARAAGLRDGDEPIHVYFHALRHPARGLFLVDTGVERALRDRPDEAVVRGLVARAMHLEKLKVRMPLGDWLAARPGPVEGVLLTHLHLDHVTGLPDVPAGAPVHTGPGEAAATAFLHLFVRGTADRALAGRPALRELPFAPDPDGRFDGVLDLFGDGMVWALLVPGHTPGSTAFLVRTPGGPVLLTGDACHTRWGWENGVEPGSFSHDVPRSADSLARLRRLAAEHPRLRVQPGHQE
jgi:glyoxylase-like metal-dependent hydrolase (beta-lactamase superfamily II)